MNELKAIDDHLLGLLDTPERLLFEARLLTSPPLQAQVKWHARLHRLLQYRFRRQLKSEAASVQRALFNDPAQAAFKKQIDQLFQC